MLVLKSFSKLLVFLTSDPLIEAEENTSEPILDVLIERPKQLQLYAFSITQSWALLGAVSIVEVSPCQKPQKFNPTLDFGWHLRKLQLCVIIDVKYLRGSQKFCLAAILLMYIGTVILLPEMVIIRST